MALVGNCLKKDRSNRFESAEDVVFALDEILGERRHLIQGANRRGLVHASGDGSVWTAFTAGGRKALPPLTLLVQQIVSVARHHWSIHSKLLWPWITLALVGWLFLWLVAEIAREALIPNLAAFKNWRTHTHLSQPLQLPRQQEPSPDTDPTGPPLPREVDEAGMTVGQHADSGPDGDGPMRRGSLP